MKQTILSTALAIAAAAALAGCQTYYVPPASGPTAKLRVQIEADDYFVVPYVWTGGLCKDPAILSLIGASPQWVTAEHAAKERSSLNMLGGTSAANAKRVERLVPAERPLALSLHSNRPGGGKLQLCNSNLSFTPESGREYEVSHMLGSNACLVAVNELVADGRGFKRVPLTSVVQHPSKCP